MKWGAIKTRLPWVLPVILLGGTTACSSKTVELEYLYALCIDNNQTQKQAIAAAVSKFMQGKKVTLAERVFMEQSTITIERQTFVDQRGLLANGRHNNAVKRFSLLKAENTCFLRDEGTKAKIALPSVKCRATDRRH